MPRVKGQQVKALPGFPSESTAVKIPARPRTAKLVFHDTLETLRDVQANMTYVLNLSPERVGIGTEVTEWEGRFPRWGPGSDVTMRIVDGWRSGTRKLEPDQLPYALIAEKPRKSWPDMFKTYGGLMVVSEAVKSIVEDHDLGLHQFFPLGLKTKRGVEIEGPWFAMNVTERRETIVMNGSTIFISETHPDWLNSISYTYRNVIVDPARQPDVHLWRESKFKNSLLASDELIDALKSADLKVFPNFKAKRPKR